jgi:hypothetical protein
MRFVADLGAGDDRETERKDQQWRGELEEGFHRRAILGCRRAKGHTATQFAL